MHLAYAVCDAEGSYERFTCISATVFRSRYDYQFLCHDTKGEGGGGPGLNFIMTLIKKKYSLEVSPNYGYMII